MAFDITLVEIKYDAGRFVVGRYGILEVQTMDFHGTYKHAVTNLRDALRLHKTKFPKELQLHPEWSCEGVEGPNIANVFKRTFYQMMLKFELAGKGAAAGTVLALPKAVWDSWQPFLGRPEIEGPKDGVYSIRREPDKAVEGNAYILVFDLNAASRKEISPVQIERFLKVSPDDLAHHAFTKVPEFMLEGFKTSDAILTTIRSRLSTWWPEITIDSGAV